MTPSKNALDIYELTSRWTLIEITLISLIFSLTLNTYKHHRVSPACNYPHENAKTFSYFFWNRENHDQMKQMYVKELKNRNRTKCWIYIWLRKCLQNMFQNNIIQTALISKEVCTFCLIRNATKHCVHFVFVLELMNLNESIFLIIFRCKMFVSGEFSTSINYFFEIPRN